MTLDVHMIKRGERWPEEGSYTGFGFGAEHGEIFRFVHTGVAAYPQLARMQDYYDDVQYEGQDLKDLAAELQRMIPQFPIDSAAGSGLRRFLELSVQAAAEQKALLLLAD